MSRGLGALEPAVAVLVTLLATLSFGPFFAGWWWLAVVGGAVLLGGLTAAVARRWGWALAGPAGIVLLVLGLVVAGYPDLTAFGLPTLDGLTALGAGLLTGVPKMLTVGLPADVVGDLLVPPAVLGAVAGAAAVALTRTASVTAGAVPPLVVFIAGLVLTASSAQPRLALTGAVVLGVLLLLLLRANRLGAASREGIDAADAEAVGVDLASRRWHSTMARVGFGVPVVAAATVLAVLAAWQLPVADGSDRADPRALREHPYRLTQTLSPLAQVRPQLTGPRRPLFGVTTSNDSGGDFRPDRVRTAGLETFDGALWTGAEEFAVAGTNLPGFQALDAPAQRVRLVVEVEAPGQSYLPVVGEPITLEGGPRTGLDAGVGFDRATATAISAGAATEPYRYTTVGEVRPLDAAARQAGPPADVGDAALTALPSRPAWVAELATQIVGDRVTPMSQLLAIEDFLRRQTYSEQALPGHSYGALKRVLLGVPADRYGNAEQYAAAFAVLARSLGFPARVAVGYLLRQENREGDRYAVFTSDAHAWPEVRLAGFGWVPFEPTDTGSPFAQPPRSPDVTLGAADSDQPVVPPTRAALDPREPVEVLADLGRAVAALLGAIALLAVLVAAAKRVRRTARARRGPPDRRVVAAWAEVVDDLRAAGLRVPVSRTAAEVAADARRHRSAVAAATAIGSLAPVVTGAVYGLEEPTDATAARAWTLATEARRHIGRSLGLGRRLWLLVDPRPLLPGRRRRRAAPRPVPVVGRTS
jgi:transglutaminase-like putative cysteine protease